MNKGDGILVSQRLLNSVTHPNLISRIDHEIFELSSIRACRSVRHVENDVAQVYCSKTRIINIKSVAVIVSLTCDGKLIVGKEMVNEVIS